MILEGLSGKLGSLESAQRIQKHKQSTQWQELYFDLASLTKPILLSSLMLKLFLREGHGADDFFSRPLQEFFPPSKGKKLGDCPLKVIWEHRSGLPSHINFCEEFSLVRGSVKPGTRADNYRKMLDRIFDLPLEKNKEIYSDLGFLVLGAMIEFQFQDNLSNLWESWKKDRGLLAQTLIFSEQLTSQMNVVPTERRHPACEVNDDNAAVLEGVAPHAGLFGNSLHVALWLEAVEKWCAEEPRLNFFLHAPANLSTRFYCGWDRPSGEEDSNFSKYWPRTSLGHLGWTGTAFIWEPVEKKFAVLLSNRVSPVASAENQAEIKRMRQDFFQAAWDDTLEKRWS